MSVDGYGQWVENKAEDYVGEITKKNPRNMGTSARASKLRVPKY